MYETQNDFEKAIQHYELSGNYKKEVPRMMVMAEKIEDLEAYVLKKNEPELTKYWAKYLESVGS
jgi:hypothetical protein